MKPLKAVVAVILCATMTATQASAQIPAPAEAAIWSGLAACRLRMMLGSELAQSLSSQGFQPIESGMRWSDATGNLVAATVASNGTVCKVIARGPGFERAAIEAWMTDWANRKYIPTAGANLTVWNSPASVMVFAFKDGAMEVVFT